MSVVQSSDFPVYTSDGVRIQVHRKIGAQPSKVPVLLIHGTWGNAQTWDFPGRSVMDYLAARGYDVYALDLRGEGSSGPIPVDYRQIEILSRVNDAAAVASYIVQNTGRAPVVTTKITARKLPLPSWLRPSFPFSGNGFLHVLN